MKKILTCLIVAMASICMSSCSNNSKYLDKPENTNLEFWITQKVNMDDFVNCTYLPGWFCASEYLDSRYKAIEGEMARAPEIHVKYLVSGYPDLKNSSSVIRIHITDPNIIVYGLTMNSSELEIETTMKNLKFKKTDSNVQMWSKNNCSFLFNKESISIYADQTNKYNIVC